MQTTSLLLSGAAIMRAPDGDGTAPVTEAAESERKKIADRDWINDAGEVVAEELATGVRYQFLGRTKDGATIPADGEAYTLYFRDLTPAATAMLCGFGAITLMGNVTNTWMGDKGDDKAEKAKDAIEARIALLNHPTEPKWIDRTGGGGGAKIDKEKLAQAVALAAIAAGKPEPDVAKVLAKMESSPDYVKAVRSIPAVAGEYAKLMGRTAATLDDVLAV